MWSNESQSKSWNPESTKLTKTEADKDTLQFRQIQAPRFPQPCTGSAPAKLIGNFSIKINVNGIKCMAWLNPIHLPTSNLLLQRQFPENAFI